MLTFIKLTEWIIFLTILIILISYFVWNLRIVTEQQSLQDLEKVSAYECGFLPFSSARICFDIQYFIVAILFLIFDLEVAWIFPFAINWNFLGYYGTWTMLKFLIILFLGLCYEISTNVLSWSSPNKEFVTSSAIIICVDTIFSEELNLQFEITLNSLKLSSTLLQIYFFFLFIFLCFLTFCNFIKTTVKNQLKILLFLSIFLCLHLINMFWMFVNIRQTSNFFSFSGYESTFAIYWDLFSIFSVNITLKLALTFLFVFNVIYRKQHIINYNLLFLLHIVFICLLFIPIVSELILLLLGLETINLCFYALLLTNISLNVSFTFFKRIEASLKYFGFSSLFTGIFFCMLLFLTILFNNISLVKIQQNIIEVLDIIYTHYFYSLTFALVMFFYFLSFKLAVFPNQKWAPDVYEGTTNLVFGILTVSVKLAIFLFFCRIIYFIFNDFFFMYSSWILYVGLGSIIFGAIGAINQKNIRRFLAYTSMHHMGFILLGTHTCLLNSLNIIIFYFITYLFAFVSFYFTYLLIEKTSVLYKKISYISDFAKLHASKLGPAFFILILSISSMGGFPPLIGFFGKYFVFYNLLLDTYTNNIVIFFIAVLTSVISAYNYLKIINLLCFKKEQINKKNTYNFLMFQITQEIFFKVSFLFFDIQRVNNVLIFSRFMKHNIDFILLSFLSIVVTVSLFPSIDWECLRLGF